jgi:formate dehydrogenase major subunit
MCDPSGDVLHGLNPVVSYPDSNHVMPSLRNSISANAGYLLERELRLRGRCPARHCFAERTDFTSASGVSTGAEAVDGPGESKYDWEIIAM